MIETSLREEKCLIEKGYSLVGGVDEVGRGCLAGPVTAAVVIFPPDLLLEPIREVVDSKAISYKKRETLSELIKNVSLSYSIASASANEIDVEFMLGMGSHESNTNTASLNLKFRMVMESITIDWNLDLPYIGVTMTGPTTGSYGDSTGTSATAPIQEVG